jgi:hydrogenase large subunit
VREIEINPVSRVEGHLSIKVRIDKEKYIDAKVSGEMFRGFEILLKGKNSSQVINIVSKICGICSATHPLVATEALEMAYGLAPNEKVIFFRNIAYGLADIMYNNILVAFVFQGIDFSSRVVPKSELNRAKETYCIYRDIHGFLKVSDIMENLYFGKEIFKEAFKLQTELRDLATLIWLRYPQPLSLKIGSMTIRDEGSILKIKKFLKEDRTIDKLLYIYAELREFYKGYYKDIEKNFITYGLFESYDYDATYENMSYWAQKRYFPPALIKDGELITSDLREILLGVRILTEGTAYDNWNYDYTQDPLGNYIHPNHPWNRETKLKGVGNFIPKIIQKEGIMPTTGDIARLYSYRIKKGKPKALGYAWDFSGNNMIERTFARVFTVAMIKEYIIEAEMPKISSFEPKVLKKQNMVVGAHDAPRGANAHWIIIENDKVKRYQIVTPTDRNFSPEGPVEDSIKGQKINEEEFKGLDALRVIRSFDPCSACAVHVINLDAL